MRSNEIVLAVIALTLVTVLIAGCTGNNAQTNAQTIPIMTRAPVSSAVDLYNKGFTNLIKGNYTAALDFFNQSISADPKYTRSWIERGSVLVKLNRTSEAIASYDSALALENNLAIVWNSRGEALMTLGNFTEARNSFDKALQFAPDFAAAKANRDLALSKIK